MTEYFLSVDIDGDVSEVNRNDVNETNKPILIAFDNQDNINLLDTNDMATKAKERCDYFINNSNFFETSYNQLNGYCGRRHVQVKSDKFAQGFEEEPVVTISDSDITLLRKENASTEFHNLPITQYIDDLNNKCIERKPEMEDNRQKLIDRENQCASTYAKFHALTVEANATLQSRGWRNGRELGRSDNYHSYEDLGTRTIGHCMDLANALSKGLNFTPDTSFDDKGTSMKGRCELGHSADRFKYNRV